VIQATLHWRALAAPAADYQVFLHVVDRSGNVVAQHDATPAGIPTSLWSPGDALTDVHEVSLPQALPAGQYSLRVGLYTLADGQRLGVTTSAAPVVDSAVALVELSLP
jgi:hypothetical protein